MKKATWILIAAATLALGIVTGNFYAGLETGNRMKSPFGRTEENKITEVVQIIDKLYVDSISIDSIAEAVIPTILSQLDPHSAYIPAADLQVTNDELSGSFGGIGVQFNIQNDTVYVVDVISGGPSELAGLLAGDRIVSVDGLTFVGKTLNNERVMKTLRGERGTKITVGIVRRNTPKILSFTVTRGDIPVKSIDVACMIAPNIGFISVNKFGITTYQEFLNGIAKVRSEGASKLIIDLRGNAGGYLDAAINMLNEFLQEGDLMVYIKGNHYARTDSYANGTGSCQTIPLVVLIDEFSGSASEIFAGAIQDNDRGQIVGRRSFGKGLVQHQVTLKDSSAVRITVARYYTPSGRCIQKPYERGRLSEYDADLWQRYLHGEFYSQDSIRQNDTTVYKTVGGRTVYGGGGIMPDIFVPRDSSGITHYFSELVNAGIIYQFALRYTEQNRARLKACNSWQALESYLESQQLFDLVAAEGAKKNVIGTMEQKRKSRTFIERQLYAYIIRNIFNDEGFFPFLNQNDVTVQRAVELLGGTKQ
ncbi:MAG: S41 family peptidase [Prevotellaceae bacterium]|jgi:carboxyl-terminal processing protease|nr:S41 family peptidase [Prevotellaceae bacterium]